MNSPKIVAEYISCLSILEENTSLTYSALSERVESPAQIKSLLLSISQDSLKHSKLLKDTANKISHSKAKRGDCAKNLGKVWSTMNNCLSEATKKEIGTRDFSMLLSMLDGLESSLREEYYNFVQTKTLQLMVNEINNLYDISLESINKVFETIIRDEERHREILGNIKDIIGDASTEDNTLSVKYQNPDSWITSMPPATYDSI
jgi:chromosome segregation ATPase